MTPGTAALRRALLVVALVAGILLPGDASPEQTPAPPADVSLAQEATWKIQPEKITCQPGEAIEFQSFVPERYSAAVKWSVTGGSITANGTYTAPTTPGTYLVEAALATGLRARALVTVAPLQAEATDAADRFVNSVGINVHLHYDNTVYRQNFALVKSRLLELRVRHVRDGLVDTSWQPFYDRHNELGRAGIKGVFVAAANTSDSLLRDYPSRVSAAFEGYEAPNEYNRSGDPQWPSTLRAALTRLHALKQIPALAAFRVFGPALTSEAAYAALGDISADIDDGNMHNYFSSYNPGTAGWGADGYGSIPWNLRVARVSSNQKPMVTTETGYFTDPAAADAVPEDVAGKYMPRLLLEQFRQGILRTYLYELADERSQRSGLGLLSAEGAPKPAFRAVSQLLSLLADPGAAHTPRPLRYSVSGGSPDLRTMTFQKRNGGYFMFLWIEAPGYDASSGRVLVVPPQTVTVTAGGGVRHVSTYRWQPNGEVNRVSLGPDPKSVAVADTQESITVTDTLQALEFRP